MWHSDRYFSVDPVKIMRMNTQLHRIKKWRQTLSEWSPADAAASKPFVSVNSRNAKPLQIVILTPHLIYTSVVCLRKWGLVYRSILYERQELAKSFGLFGLVTLLTYSSLCHKYASGYDRRLLLLHYKIAFFASDTLIMRFNRTYLGSKTPKKHKNVFQIDISS